MKKYFGLHELKLKGLPNFGWPSNFLEAQHLIRRQNDQEFLWNYSRELQNIYVFPGPSSFSNQNIKVKVNRVHNSENQRVNVIFGFRLGLPFVASSAKDNSVDITLCQAESWIS